jgi:hypothetical protein
VWLIILSDQLTIVALVSRYLTNKLMVRGLISKQQLPWSGHLSSIQPKPNGLHPVLAPLSKGYPKLEGRLPTRYSPVRHFTRQKQALGFLVRLACVTHAASVYSEPGSNSPIDLITADITIPVSQYDHAVITSQRPSLTLPLSSFQRSEAWSKTSCTPVLLLKS